MNPNALVILQARTASTRFPRKVLQKLNGQPMILRQLERVKLAKNIEQIVVATTLDESDDELTSLLEQYSYKVIRGSINDVLSRYLLAIDKYDFPVVVRLTADCPLVMPDLIDSIVEEFANSDADYVSNTMNPTYPDGLDVEVFSSHALKKLSLINLSDQEKEHVTLGFHKYKEIFRLVSYESSENLSDLRWTVDYPEDFKFVSQVYSHFSGLELEFRFGDILDLMKMRPDLKSTISANRRNEALSLQIRDISK